MAGSSLLGGLNSAKAAQQGAREANEANAQEAERNREFQAYMSRTAHQREVEDLRLAGLNPLLSVNGGASTPSGSMATYENVNKDLPNNVMNSARIAMETLMNRATIKKIQSDTALNSALEAKAKTETAKTREGTVPGTDIPIATFRNFIDRTTNSARRFDRSQQIIDAWTERKKRKALALEFENRRVKG